MMRVSLTVNGRPAAADVAPRTHLADFLRESLLLTGTHLGCEQGVCGACTVLLNGEPARSCLTFAALCDGIEVQTIEGLADDPLGAALRQAFQEEHALQCGYCTPGMLVTARDIVQRLPDADADRIRVELAGNLCRCTGYNGIVRAIQRVIAAGGFSVQAGREPVPASPALELAPAGLPAAAAVPAAMPPVTAASATLPLLASRPATTPGSPAMTQVLRIPLPADTVWQAVQDPAVFAACIPGARITSVTGDRVEGEMTASLGPIQAHFTGEAMVRLDPTARTGQVTGEGRDKRTKLSAEAAFAVAPDGADAAVLTVEIRYHLTGPLAQFSRGPIIDAFARELAADLVRNLTARLQGQPQPARAATPWALRLAWRTLRAWLAGRRG